MHKQESALTIKGTWRSCCCAWMNSLHCCTSRLISSISSSCVSLGITSVLACSWFCTWKAWQTSPKVTHLLARVWRYGPAAGRTLAVQLLHVVSQFPPLLPDAVCELLPSVLAGLVQGVSAAVPRLLLSVWTDLHKAEPMWRYFKKKIKKV